MTKILITPSSPFEISTNASNIFEYKGIKYTQLVYVTEWVKEMVKKVIEWKEEYEIIEGNDL